MQISQSFLFISYLFGGCLSYGYDQIYFSEISGLYGQKIQSSYQQPVRRQVGKKHKAIKDLSIFFDQPPSKKSKSPAKLEHSKGQQYQRLMDQATELRADTTGHHPAPTPTEQYIVKRSNLPKDSSAVNTSRGRGFSISRGPYDEAYHWQVYDNRPDVMAIMGKTANYAARPSMNSILSNIVLKSNWEIYRT